jgi:citrate synthase
MVSHASTSIATSTTDSITVRDMSLTKELIGHVDFVSMMVLQMLGRLPSTAEHAMLDASLVAVMEHGLTGSAIAARLTYRGAPEALQGAVAAGLLGVGSQVLGSMEDAARLLQQTVERVGPGGSELAEAAAELVADSRARKKTIPGFGHRFHRPDDPRVARLFEVADEHGVTGPHRVLLESMSEAMDSAAGKHVPINVTGAIGAVMSDVGFSFRIVRGFGLIARTAGLVGHLLEEIEQPIAGSVADLIEEHFPYRPNPARAGSESA